MAGIRIRWCAIAVIAGLALAGCGSSSSETSGTGAGAGTEAGATSGESGAATGAAKTSTAPIGAAVAGCKDAAGGIGHLRVTNAECVYARGIAADWVAKRACAGAAGASRTACTIGGFRCLGARTGQGIAVSCAQPGRSISFIARRG